MTLARRLLTSTLIVALPASILPGAAAAEVIDGRPGQFPMSSMLIDAVTADCLATYETPVGNIYIRGAGATVHVVTGRAGARATCRFTDISVVNEANAEVGYTTACTLVTAAGTWSGGTGRVTSAANISDRSDGGNSMIRCRFDAEPGAGARGPGAYRWGRRDHRRPRRTRSAGAPRSGLDKASVRGQQVAASQRAPRRESGGNTGEGPEGESWLRAERGPQGCRVDETRWEDRGRQEARQGPSPTLN